MLNVATAIMNTCPAERHETREKGSCGRGGGKGHHFAGTQTRNQKPEKHHLPQATKTRKA